jgi:hypothetical protein
MAIVPGRAPARGHECRVIHEVAHVARLGCGGEVGEIADSRLPGSRRERSGGSPSNGRSDRAYLRPDSWPGIGGAGQSGIRSQPVACGWPPRSGDDAPLPARSSTPAPVVRRLCQPSQGECAPADSPRREFPGYLALSGAVTRARRPPLPGGRTNACRGDPSAAAADGPRNNAWLDGPQRWADLPCRRLP